jgi:hypothetical protein
MFISSPLSTLVIVASLLGGASARKPPIKSDIAKYVPFLLVPAVLTSRLKDAIPLRYIVEFDSADHLRQANLKKRDTTVGPLRSLE